MRAYERLIDYVKVYTTSDENSESVPVTKLREEIRAAISRNRFGGIILFAEGDICQGQVVHTAVALINRPAPFRRAPDEGHVLEVNRACP